MSTLPLGLGAYKRLAGGFPEVKCENRFVEQTPINQLERTSLITRAGMKLLDYFAPDSASGTIRGCYTELGLFGDDLFVVSGTNLYRYNGTDDPIHISGEIHDGGRPKVTFVKGSDFTRMWIVDGLLLQYYDGGSQGTGTLTDDGSGTYTDKTITVGTTYYGWNATDVDDGTPDGTSDNPFLCLTGSTAEESLENMANMLNFIGTPGTDFSSALTTANLDVSADSTATTLTLTSRETSSDVNDIALASSDTHLTWADDTLTGAGTHNLHGCNIPNGESVTTCASLNEFVFVGCKNSRRFYIVRPGEVTIDALDFFTKESHPDNIVDMNRVGDVIVIQGNGSTEFWSATGDNDAPFSPIEGRTMSRGIVEGTAVMVDEATIIVVGNDMRVYSIAASIQPISDHSMEERIRRQLRTEAGL